MNSYNSMSSYTRTVRYFSNSATEANFILNATNGTEEWYICQFNGTYWNVVLEDGRTGQKAYGTASRAFLSGGRTQWHMAFSASGQNYYITIIYRD